MNNSEMETEMNETISRSMSDSGNDSSFDLTNYSSEYHNDSWICDHNFRTDTFRHTVYFHVVVSFMYFVIFCVALFGNAAVCCIVKSIPRMRTVTNYFIANLALGDLLMAVFCVPFTFVPMLILNYWPFGFLLCRLVNFSQVVSVFVSAYTLVALAGDRYRSITAPLKPRLSKPKAKAIIATVWIGAIATACPTSFVVVLTYPNKEHEMCRKSICREEWPLPYQGDYYSMALLILQFIIPLFVLIFTYTRIAFAVWGKPPGEAENSRDKRMAQSKRKMVKMMIVIVVVFTVCWLPLNIFLLLYDVTWEDWWPTAYIWFMAHWLAMSHSCYNPIIYCYMNARFRVSFLQILSKIPCCRKFAKDRLSLADGAIRSSLAGNIPMTGIETSDQTLFRINTDTTYVSVRRGPGHLTGRNSGDLMSHSTYARARYSDTSLNNRI